jgi:diguanylate cyclase (GGDEF)-like protein
MEYLQHTFAPKISIFEMPTALCLSEDKAFLNTIRLNLGKSGFVVIITSNPAEAAVLAEDNKIDAIICDYNLSRTDGITFFESMLEQKGIDATPPTLIVSEQYAAPLLTRCVNAGAAGLHSKTEPVETLVERVISILKDSKTRNYLEINSPKRAIQGGTDPLTKIASKHHFARRFSAESVASYRDHNSISLLVMSVDRYDLLQERHGKQNAENTLANAARLIEGELRSRDCVGRHSEHTFAIVLPETTLEAATSVADRLKRLLSTTEFGNLDDPIDITVSSGVASRPAGIRLSPDELFTRAMTNCIAAQKLGGNKVVADKGLSGKPIALLIGNDNEMSARLIVEMEKSNIEIRTTRTIKSAKQILEQIPTAVITMIYPLAEKKSGIDFLIWTRNKYPRAKRILLSGDVTPQFMFKAVNEAAIDYFLPIPWETEKLFDILDSLIFA